MVNLLNGLPVYLTGSWSKARNGPNSDLDLFTDLATWEKFCAPYLDATGTYYNSLPKKRVAELRTRFNDPELIDVFHIPDHNIDIQVQPNGDALQKRIAAEVREINDCLVMLISDTKRGSIDPLRFDILVSNLLLLLKGHDMTQENSTAPEKVPARMLEIDPGHIYVETDGGQQIRFIKWQAGALIHSGATNEGLLEILIARTRSLNEKFPCVENEKALISMQNALDYFDERTAKRKVQGVETLDKPHVS